jgi:hypothetical protein
MILIENNEEAIRRGTVIPRRTKGLLGCQKPCLLSTLSSHAANDIQDNAEDDRACPNKHPGLKL